MGNWRRNQCKQIIALSIGLAVVAVASATMNVATYRMAVDSSNADGDTKVYVQDQISEVTKRLDELRSDLDGKR